MTLAENPLRKRKKMQGDHLKTQPKIITLQKFIFKSGYDIRLEQLVLQMIKIMDNIWLQKTTLDLKMLIYKTVTVSDMTGYVEVVGDFEYWVSNKHSTKEE